MIRRDSHYYQNNIDTLVARAERRVEALKIQKEIFAIDAKLKILKALCPPQRAADPEPSEVHPAPHP
jgi:hypothetical protein